MGPDLKEHNDRDICRRLWIVAAEFLDSCGNIRKTYFYPSSGLEKNY
jgi:hypothetical protein